MSKGLKCLNLHFFPILSLFYFILKNQEARVGLVSAAAGFTLVATESVLKGPNLHPLHYSDCPSTCSDKFPIRCNSGTETRWMWLTCSSNRASKCGRRGISAALQAACLLPDTLFWVFYTQPQGNGPKKRKYSVSGICVNTNRNSNGHKLQTGFAEFCLWTLTCSFKLESMVFVKSVNQSN